MSTPILLHIRISYMLSRNIVHLNAMNSTSDIVWCHYYHIVYASSQSHRLNIIQSHNNILRDWQYFAKYFSHSNWMWRIFVWILSVPQNIVMALNQWMGEFMGWLKFLPFFPHIFWWLSMLIRLMPKLINSIRWEALCFLGFLVIFPKFL